MAAFASADDLAAVWRPLSGAERTAAESYLDAAAALIRDAYKAAHGTELPADREEAAAAVSLDMVKTAIATGAYVGHLAYGRTEGPRSKSGTLAAAGGSLALLAWHRELLGLPVTPEPRYYFPRNDY